MNGDVSQWSLQGHAEHIRVIKNVDANHEMRSGYVILLEE